MAPTTHPPSPAPAGPEDFPRQYARTRRFTAGAPRSFAVAPDRSMVLFLRSGADPADPLALWSLDVPRRTERCVADPATLLDDGRTPDAELARRERTRESSPGIVDFCLDRSATRAAFALSGRLFGVDLLEATPPRRIGTAGDVVDPRLSPDGRFVAYVSGARLCVTDWHGTGRDPTAERVLSPDGPSPSSPAVGWGVADFAAAEEFHRSRGHWWSPASDVVLAERVDDSGVPALHIADPAFPQRPAREHRYPFAGGPNAEVGLWLLGLDGTSVEVAWDRTSFPYLVSVSWVSQQSPVILVMSRDQRRAAVLALGAASGAVSSLRQTEDLRWVDAVEGAPAIDPDGRLLSVEVVSGHRRLLAGGEVVSPDGVDVEGLFAESVPVLVTTSGPSSERHVWRLDGDRLTPLTTEPGVHRGFAGGDTVVLSRASLADARWTHRVVVGGAPAGEVASLAETPVVEPHVEITEVAGVPTAVLLPSWHEPGARRLPVLFDPYGGPSGARVLRCGAAFLVSQWFAEMGFAVVVADGRGTPGSPGWERAIAGDLAAPVLADQVAVLEALLAARDLDATAVGIRGWSFGGFLAALAVMTRPDRFHAAVAGAPPTDWRLYDTAYTERYLGTDPDGADADAYRRSSLLPLAASPTRPLLLVHGLADDNVLAAHFLRLSQALLGAGRPHSFLPLSGVTHMTPQARVSENLLRLELDFFRHHLGVEGKG